MVSPARITNTEASATRTTAGAGRAIQRGMRAGRHASDRAIGASAKSAHRGPCTLTSPIVTAAAIADTSACSVRLTTSEASGAAGSGTPGLLRAWRGGGGGDAAIDVLGRHLRD